MKTIYSEGALSEKVLGLVHTALVEREQALGVPFLGTDIVNILGVTETPLWLNDSYGPRILARLVDLGRLRQVPLEDLRKLAGNGLPLLKYWPHRHVGWAVVRDNDA